jgi:radical SAM protein with 4Fe4S-binding SPASM domain
MWRKSVEGLKTVVATPGLRAGIAMCVHKDNLDEVESMLQFAVDHGVSCFAHFNFIPVGRGAAMGAQDISPQQREDLLQLLHRWMQSRRIGVISTAPQFGRICLTHADENGLVSCSHAGNAAGIKARVVARYLGGCGAGRTYACIEPNGDVTPCVYLPHRVLGSVRQRRFADIFRNNPFWDLLCDRTKLTHHCAVCAFRNYCGGCRARADAYFGALNAGDPGCLFNEKHWEALVAEGAATEAANVEGRQRVKTYDGCATSWVAST